MRCSAACPVWLQLPVRRTDPCSLQQTRSLNESATWTKGRRPGPGLSEQSRAPGLGLARDGMIWKWGEGKKCGGPGKVLGLMRMHKRRTRRHWQRPGAFFIGMLVEAIVALGLGGRRRCNSQQRRHRPQRRPGHRQLHRRVRLFASGQNINAVIPANTAFVFSGQQHGEADRRVAWVQNGVVPTLTTACDGLDQSRAPPLWPTPDGSFTLTNYTVYALPDLVSLGEGSGGPAGATPATECILYIGDNYEDFTAPHLWSDPFFIEPNNASPDSGTPAGDGTAPAVSSVPGREQLDRGGEPGHGPGRRGQLVDGDRHPSRHQ